MNYKTLRYEHADHVVTLTYDRPDQHNAVNRTMNAELHHAWQRFRDDEDAFVLGKASDLNMLFPTSPTPPSSSREATSTTPAAATSTWRRCSAGRARPAHNAVAPSNNLA